MKKAIGFIVLLIIVLAVETAGLYFIGTLVGKLTGTHPTPVWVCVLFVLFGNILYGKRVYGKRK